MMSEAVEYSKDSKRGRKEGKRKDKRVEERIQHINRVLWYNTW